MQRHNLRLESQSAEHGQEPDAADLHDSEDDEPSALGIAAQRHVVGTGGLGQSHLDVAGAAVGWHVIEDAVLLVQRRRGGCHGGVELQQVVDGPPAAGHPRRAHCHSRWRQTTSLKKKNSILFFFFQIY